MSALSIRRAVEDYLRDAYGVREFKTVQNKHRKLSFEYAGSHHVLTLPVTPGHDDHTAVAMKKQNIRNELGPPLIIGPIKHKRRLEDMMPEPRPNTAAVPFNTPLAELSSIASTKTDTVAIPPKPVEFSGKVASYASSNNSRSLRFYIPIGMVKTLMPGPFSLTAVRNGT